MMWLVLGILVVTEWSCIPCVVAEIAMTGDMAGTPVTLTQEKKIHRDNFCLGPGALMCIFNYTNNLSVVDVKTPFSHALNIELLSACHSGHIYVEVTFVDATSPDTMWRTCVENVHTNDITLEMTQLVQIRGTHRLYVPVGSWSIQVLVGVSNMIGSLPCRVDSVQMTHSVVAGAQSNVSLHVLESGAAAPTSESKHVVLTPALVLPQPTVAGVHPTSAELRALLKQQYDWPRAWDFDDFEVEYVDGVNPTYALIPKPQNQRGKNLKYGAGLSASTSTFVDPNDVPFQSAVTYKLSGRVHVQQQMPQTRLDDYASCICVTLGELRRVESHQTSVNRRTSTIHLCSFNFDINSSSSVPVTVSFSFPQSSGVFAIFLARPEAHLTRIESIRFDVYGPEKKSSLWVILTVALTSCGLLLAIILGIFLYRRRVRFRTQKNPVDYELGLAPLYGPSDIPVHPPQTIPSHS